MKKERTETFQTRVSCASESQLDARILQMAAKGFTVVKRGKTFMSVYTKYWAILERKDEAPHTL